MIHIKGRVANPACLRNKLEKELGQSKARHLQLVEDQKQEVLAIALALVILFLLTKSMKQLFYEINLASCTRFPNTHRSIGCEMKLPRYSIYICFM